MKKTIQIISIITLLTFATSSICLGEACQDKLAVKAAIYRLRLEGTQAQDTLQSRIAANNPTSHEFIKDAPIMAYRITSDRFEDIPEAIRMHLGATDQTQYTPEYLAANLGSVLALQMDGDKPDFYIVGKSTFDEKYEVVPAGDVGVKNPKLLGKLQGVERIAALVDSGDEHLVGALKTVPVQMVKMSEIMYPVETEVTIESPWGEQTKPAGQDAYLVFDEGKDMYYMVNSDEAGNPLSYVPVATEGTGTVVAEEPIEEGVQAAEAA